MVNNPPHYGEGAYQTIMVIEAWGLNYRLGNAVKYISRADRKGKQLEDLKKAAWYLNREIAALEAEQEKQEDRREFGHKLDCDAVKGGTGGVCDMDCFESPVKVRNLTFADARAKAGWVSEGTTTTVHHGSNGKVVGGGGGSLESSGEFFRYISVFTDITNDQFKQYTIYAHTDWTIEEMAGRIATDSGEYSCGTFGISISPLKGAKTLHCRSSVKWMLDNFPPERYNYYLRKTAL